MELECVPIHPFLAPRLGLKPLLGRYMEIVESQLTHRINSDNTVIFLLLEQVWCQIIDWAASAKAWT